MKRFLIILALIMIFLFLFAFPGLSSLLTTSQLREDLLFYCQSTSPLVDRESEMYRLYQKGDSTSIYTKAQAASSDLLKHRPKTKEVNRIHNRYLIIWDNWANDNVADLFGYGNEDNELIRYHEDVLELADKLGVSDKELGSYSLSKWKKEKKRIIKISKKYLLGAD